MASDTDTRAGAERAAIVTGGSRGIGRAIAQALADDGYAVTITARQPAGLDDAVRALRAGGAEVQGVARNLADADAPGEVVAAHAERYGRLDVLVNNAGVGIGARVADQQTKHLDLMIDINLRAMMLFYREAAALLRSTAAQAGQAHVINLSSITGKWGQPWLSAYSATKGAVVSYTEAMSRELAADAIKSTALCPEWVDTDMTDFIKERVPREEMIPVSDIVEAVRFLLRLSPGCSVPEIVFTRPGHVLTPV